MKSIGSRIKHIRLKNNFTQVEFACKICLSQSHLSKIEHDIEKPSKAVIRLISILFDTEEDWIRGVEE